jgi:mannonate dehydratase
MKPTMRWFGDRDPVTLSNIRQCGAIEVVTALHEVTNGEIWPLLQIVSRKDKVRESGLDWTVVESLPVTDELKRRGPRWDELIDNYCTSIRNLALCDITVVTYNFMPVIDWTRTDLAFPMPDGALALRFDFAAVAAFDLFILRRPGSEAEYAPHVAAAAERIFAAMDTAARGRLARTIIAGLPGSEESFTARDFQAALNTYKGIDAARLRANHVAFLEAVCPVAEEVGVQLVVHPDDPPMSLFGLPRVVSTEGDLSDLFEAVPSPANGLCYCAASFSLHPDNDVVRIVERFGDRIGFAHLRSVAHEPNYGFYESAHLEGDSRIVEVVAELHRLQQRSGRSIPMRPDHGHVILDDLTRKTNPGYSLLGQMRGLAELRGLELGIAHALN